MTERENFPLHILQVVFRQLSVHEVRRMLLVCKAWHNEADIFLKDKIWLCVHRVRDVKDLWNSQRRFENLEVISERKVLAIESFNTYNRGTFYDDDFIEDVLLALENRKTSHKVRISRIRTSFDLSRILRVLGSKIKSLHLRNLRLHEDIAAFPTSNTVRELELHYLDESSIERLLSFRNLRILKIYRCDLSRDLLKLFVNRNLYLEELHIDIYGNHPELLSFQKLHQLKVLHCFGTYISKSISLKNKLPLKCLHLEYSQLDDSDMFDITSNFSELKDLRIECFTSEVTDVGIRVIMKLPMLENLTTSYVGAKHFLDGVRNYTLRELNLTGIVDTDFLIACSEATPNLEAVKVGALTYEDPSFMIALARNWRYLKHMRMSFEEVSIGNTMEEQIIWFEKLQTLETEIEWNFLSWVRAPILKTLLLREPKRNVLFRSSNDHQIESLKKNFPKLESVEFEGDFKFQLISKYLETFKNLKSVIFGNIEALTFTDILNLVAGYEGRLELIVVVGAQVSVGILKRVLDERCWNYFLERDEYCDTAKSVLLNGLEIRFVE